MSKKVSDTIIAMLEGCGMQLGENAVIGTTGFLAESNRGLKQTKDWDYYSQEERQALNKEINKQFYARCAESVMTGGS